MRLGTAHEYRADCSCQKCRASDRERRYERKADRIARIAAEMRAYNLTHGSGCKSRARAIEYRTAGAGA